MVLTPPPVEHSLIGNSNKVHGGATGEFGRDLGFWPGSG
ncbi:hypothetical protein CCACVL1_06195 [Corchorus capsularis]|uniref:Uncharacterized protein n=1 Tax=Corchorus capsularis TaxID=210143 RepID=A0A1R3JGY6_COCAP|nr:hypothetical protein CCACVL1_06195 [Corchorus capsularis]